VIVHQFRVKSEVRQPHYRLLMSDLHLGSPNADHDEIISDLEAAKSVGARVLINGDVFDAIGPTDRRYSLGDLHPDVAGKKDLARAIVDLAFDLLQPYRKLIDVIGIGNHEEAWIKYNHGDPVRTLIDRLNAEEGPQKVRHGGFWGYINTTYQIADERARPRHKLLYLHGAGGDSPVTKGTIDFNRKGRNWDYDALTFGHKHNKVLSEEAVMDLSRKGKVFVKNQLNLQTGSYYQNYRQLPEAEPLDYSYAESKTHPPKPFGGLFLIMRPDVNKHGVWFVRQDYASDIVPPWKKRRAA
jgi:hypothetical protein